MKAPFAVQVVKRYERLDTVHVEANSLEEALVNAVEYFSPSKTDDDCCYSPGDSATEIVVIDVQPLVSLQLEVEASEEDEEAEKEDDI